MNSSCSFLTNFLMKWKDINWEEQEQQLSARLWTHGATDWLAVDTMSDFQTIAACSKKSLHTKGHFFPSPHLLGSTAINTTYSNFLFFRQDEDTF